MKRRDFLRAMGVGSASLAVSRKPLAAEKLSRRVSVKVQNRPNILFCISDDQSWMHAGAYGDPAVKTPGFDRVAEEGVLFNHAYTACPSCTPSRSAILTGQAMWRLEQGGILFSFLPAKFDVFPLLLEKVGYEIASTGKAWGPGRLEPGGWKQSPTGRAYNRHQRKPSLPGISFNDYAANFEEFFRNRDRRRPFFFWYGSYEPHLGYSPGAGLKAGKKLEEARLPGCLPDSPVTRGEILDYYMEIEHFDSHLVRMIQLLQQAGELDHTLIIVTSDNGNPLPRCKANLYDYGTRMPLAIRWPKNVAGGRGVDDFVSLTDIAPTLLEIAGADPPEATTGRSLWPILTSGKSGRVDPDRDFVVTAFERHTWCRRNGVGYPMRAIRTHQYAYIRNYEPGRWPAGDPDFVASHQGFYGDVDRGASKTYMMKNCSDAKVVRLFQLAFGRRPAEELYDMGKDPAQLKNLADDPVYTNLKRELASRLRRYLTDHNDPRVHGESPWDTYPFYHNIVNDSNWRTVGRKD